MEKSKRNNAVGNAKLPNTINSLRAYAKYTTTELSYMKIYII